MGIFNTSSPFDVYVERATSEKNTSDDWGQIMDVCDRTKESPTGPKDCLKSINRRLSNDNPRVVLQAITLLDACVNNCGRKFLLEIAGRDFEQELQKLITSSRTHPKVSQKLRESLKKWSEEEFKADKELSLIPALYNRLVKEGYEFEFTSDSPKKTVKYSTDPNVVNSAQEEEDIAKAIQLSLQESGSSSYKPGSGSRSAPSGSLYANASAALSSDYPAEASLPEKEPMKVRALYDFEAAEDNELTFKAGEIIIILDNSDSNWWKGTNHRGEGLFPANFVTTKLEDDTSYESESSAAGKRVSFSECVEVTEVEDAPSESTVEATGEIDEDKIDQLLHLLHEADPTGERHDDPSLPVLEEQVNAMAPSIDAELECIDKKHAQLARISTDLVDALSLYHQLMREMPSPMPYYLPYSKMMPTGPQGGPMMPPQYHPHMQHPQMYPPNHYPPYMGPPVGMLPQYMPQYMGTSGGPPPSVHAGSPSHHPGSSQPPQNTFQHMPNPGEGTIPDYNHFNQGAGAPDLVGVPSGEHLGPQPSQPPVTSNPPAAASIPPQGYPQPIPLQGHPMSLPQVSQNSQINAHAQGPIMSLQQPQVPASIPLHSLPGMLPPQQNSSSISLQGPPTNMPPGPLPTSMPPSMPFYPQPPIHSMQQPLL